MLHIADENQDDEIQFFEFANVAMQARLRVRIIASPTPSPSPSPTPTPTPNVAMQMEFDREALDNKRANLARQRGNARSVLKRIGARP